MKAFSNISNSENGTAKNLNQSRLMKLLGCIFVAVILLQIFAMMPVFAEEAHKIVPLNDGNIQYLGRWQINEDGSANGYFQSSLRFSFTGKTLKLITINKTSVVAKIDSGKHEVYHANANKEIIFNTAALAADAVHTVEIHLLDFQGNDEYPRIKHFLIDANASVKKPAQKKTIEFVGDSITHGWLGQGHPNGVHSTYGFKAAEKLGFAHDGVAFSGITLVPGSGNPDKTGMSSRYFKLSHKDLNSPAWNTAKYIPDYLVINLGTNDFAGSNDFKKVYTEFLTKLRKAYPNTVIFLTTPFGGKYKNDIQQVAQGLSSDKKLVYIDSSNWITKADMTDGLHPSAQGHDILADKLVAQINAYLKNGGATSPPTATVSKAPAETGKTDITTSLIETGDTTENANIANTTKSSTAQQDNSDMTSGNVSSQLPPSKKSGFDFKWLLLLLFPLGGATVFFAVKRIKNKEE